MSDEMKIDKKCHRCKKNIGSYEDYRPYKRYCDNCLKILNAESGERLKAKFMIKYHEERLKK